jgi:hypothetical protein
MPRAGDAVPATRRRDAAAPRSDAALIRMGVLLTRVPLKWARRPSLVPAMSTETPLE